MRQSIMIAILVIAVGSVAGAGPSTTLGEEMRIFELCPVCGSAGVRTENPKGAERCHFCGIVLRQPRRKALRERVFSRLASAAHYGEEHLDGSFDTRVFFPTGKSDARGEGRLMIEWTKDLSENLSFESTLDLRNDTSNLAYGAPESVGETHRTAVGLERAVFLWRGEAVDLTLGKFVLPWGRADKINPTNPMAYDYTDLLDNERIGMVGGSWKYSWGVASAIELVAFPLATSSILPNAKSEWFLLPFVGSEGEGGAAYGASFSSTLATVDYSLSWFDGVETMPALRLGFPPRLVYNPYRAIGMDFETTWHGFGIRGETAYRTHENGAGDTSVRSILGLDYRWEDVARSRDSLHCFLSYARDDVREEGTDIEYPYPFTNSLVGKIEYAYDADTQFALSIVATIDRGAPRLPAVRGGDWYLQPEIRRKFGEWDVTIGADILEGSKDSFFGFFGDNDRVTLGLRKEF